MKAKFKAYLIDQVYAILSVDITIPKEQKALAESLGITEQEQTNLTGQMLQEILYLLGNSDEV
jgi:hypothetical protein